MESKAKYTFVGAAVILLTVMIVAAVLWLSEAGALRHAKYFSIYFKKHALYGLQPDSYVTMRGIKVGSVTSLEISPRNIEEVQVVLMLDGDAPVKTDTVAVLNRNLLTGFASLDLAKGTQNAPLLTQAPEGEQYPVIPEGNTDLETIADSFPALLEKVSQMTARVDALLSEENIDSVSKTLKNVKDVSSTLAQNKLQIEAAIKNVESAAAQLGKFGRSLNEITGENGGKIRETMDEILASVKDVHAAVADIRKESGGAMKSLSNAALSLSQQMNQLTQSLSDAAQTTATTMESFQQPRKILSGPSKESLGPGEGGSR